MGTAGYIVPPPKFRTCTRCKDAIRVKDAAYVKIQKQTTLTTRLYKVRTNLYSPTYENVPTRISGVATCIFFHSSAYKTRVWQKRILLSPHTDVLINSFQYKSINTVDDTLSTTPSEVCDAEIDTY